MAFGQGLDGSSMKVAPEGLRVMARSVLREMKQAGCSHAEMVAFASELIELVTREMRSDGTDIGVASQD